MYGQTAYYQGAFFVQSAGNQGVDACSDTTASYAYMPAVGFLPGGPPPNWSADPTDGIMVVGAIHHTGDAATPNAPYPAPPTGFSDSYPAGLSDPVVTVASNYGACVDVWAPGNLIVSTWGMNDGSPNTVMEPPDPGYYSGNPASGNQGWTFLSGTSMAAPHIAGAAAYLADYFALTTPAAIEAKVREYATQSFGKTDLSGIPLKVLQLP